MASHDQIVPGPNMIDRLQILPLTQYVLRLANWRGSFEASLISIDVHCTRE
jgi:hypothetical protein